MDHKYEIEIVNYGQHHWFDSEVAMLTGLEMDDFKHLTWPITRWTGQAYIRVFRGLGFNTNDRFVKFKRDTEHPCMMRCKIPHDKAHWAGFVYYDNHIYHPDEGKLTWAEWNAMWPNYKVTSMLQVWIETTQKLNERTDKAWI
jgi:hypothetical protein